MEANQGLSRLAAVGRSAGPFDWPQTLVARGPEPLSQRHLRRRPVSLPVVRLHCFVLDCSASMAASGGLARAKGVLLALLEQAYRRREQVALVCFGGAQAELRLSPRKAAAWNEDWIAPIRGGGGTPLGLAVDLAGRVLEAHAGQGESWLWLLTDGRSRETPQRPRQAGQAWVIDFEQGRIRLNRARMLADDWQARYAPAREWEPLGSGGALHGQLIF